MALSVRHPTKDIEAKNQARVGQTAERGEKVRVVINLPVREGPLAKMEGAVEVEHETTSTRDHSCLNRLLCLYGFAADVANPIVVEIVNERADVDTDFSVTSIGANPVTRSGGTY